MRANRVDLALDEAEQKAAEVIDTSALEPVEPRRGHVIGVARIIETPKVMGPLPPDDDPLAA